MHSVCWQPRARARKQGGEASGRGLCTAHRTFERPAGYINGRVSLVEQLRKAPGAVRGGVDPETPDCRGDRGALRVGDQRHDAGLRVEGVELRAALRQLFLEKLPARATMSVM